MRRKAPRHRPDPRTALDPSIRLGRILFAAGLLALGVQALFRAVAVPALEPLPHWLWLPVELPLARLSGLLLIGNSLALLCDWNARGAASALGLLLLLWLAALHLPALALQPRDGSAWTGASETLALSGGAWALAGLLDSGRSLRRGWDHVIERGAYAGRLCFGLSLLVFGVLHCIYIDYVASVIPDWIPAPLLWGGLTAVTNIAAGLAIVSGWRARLVATLLASISGVWLLILHIPRVAVRLDDADEWASLFIATALCGCAWLIAGTLPWRTTAFSRQKKSRRDGIAA